MATHCDPSQATSDSIEPIRDWCKAQVTRSLLVRAILTLMSGVARPPTAIVVEPFAATSASDDQSPELDQRHTRPSVLLPIRPPKPTATHIPSAHTTSPRQKGVATGPAHTSPSGLVATSPG